MTDADRIQCENFTYNLTWLRKHCGITKKKMADLLGISVSSINKIEKGELPPMLRVGVLLSIKVHFNIKPSDMIERRLDE